MVKVENKETLRLLTKRFMKNEPSKKYYCCYCNHVDITVIYKPLCGERIHDTFQKSNGN